MAGHRNHVRGVDLDARRLGASVVRASRIASKAPGAYREMDIDEGTGNDH
jgi:hypothetical protein